MPSLIDPNLMAQLFLRRTMPNTVNTGMGQALPPPQPGLLAAHQQQRMQAQPTPGRGPAPAGGMSPLAEGITRQRYMEAFGIDEADHDKYKDVPIQQLPHLLGVVSQQRQQQAAAERQAATAQLQEQRYQEGQKHTRMREQRADRAEADRGRREDFREAQTDLGDVQRQIKELTDREEHESDPNIGTDLTAARQHEMAARQRMQQFMPGQQPAGPQMAGQQGRPLDPQTAMHFYHQAGGDRDKARKLAQAAGFQF